MTHALTVVETRDQPAILVAEFGRDDLVDRAADDFGPGVPEYTFGGPIPDLNRSVHRVTDNRVVSGINESGKLNEYWIHRLHEPASAYRTAFSGLWCSRGDASSSAVK
jgi:hypothetical protein